MAPTPRGCSCCRTARPSAISNGPKPASTVRGATSTACGGMVSAAAAALPASGTADAGRRCDPARRRAAPADASPVASVDRRSRAVPFQQRGGAHPRIDQRPGRTARRRTGAAWVLREALESAGAAARPDDAASRRGDVATAGPRTSAGDEPWPEADPALLVERSRHRGGAGQRQAARRPRRWPKTPMPAATASRGAGAAGGDRGSGSAGKPPRKVIVVPNRIVNVVA